MASFDQESLGYEEEGGVDLDALNQALQEADEAEEIARRKRAVAQALAREQEQARRGGDQSASANPTFVPWGAKGSRGGQASASGAGREGGQSGAKGGQHPSFSSPSQFGRPFSGVTDP